MKQYLIRYKYTLKGRTSYAIGNTILSAKTKNEAKNIFTGQRSNADEYEYLVIIQK